jgi:hypothetical protein
MTRFVAFLGLFLSFLIIFQTPAHAAECGKRDKVIQILQRKHKEIQVAGGMTGNQMVMEIWASKDGKSWTILYTNTLGVSCVVAEGQAFYKMNPKPIEDPDA